MCIAELCVQMSARRGCRDVCPASRVQEVQNSGPAAPRTPTPDPRKVCLTSVRGHPILPVSQASCSAWLFSFSLFPRPVTKPCHLSLQNMSLSQQLLSRPLTTARCSSRPPAGRGQEPLVGHRPFPRLVVLGAAGVTVLS